MFWSLKLIPLQQCQGLPLWLWSVQLLLPFPIPLHLLLVCPSLPLLGLPLAHLPHSWVSSTAGVSSSTTTSIPGTFSLWSTPIVHNTPSRSQPGARHSSMGHPSRVVLESGFFPPTGNPVPSQNPNMGLLYGWNWTSSVPVSSQATSSSYSGFGPNIGSFNQSGNPPVGGINSFFQPTPMGVTPNPQMPGGGNVPLQHPFLGSRYTPNIPN